MYGIIFTAFAFIILLGCSPFFILFLVMVNYYKLLKVSPKATNSEIKSAYRRLARKHHPDLNNGTENASREFAQIAKAYEVLGNPQQRADYDRQLLNEKYNSGDSGSVFSSSNAHAKRWRQMVYERRYNAIIDRMIADERRETLALQKVIFPTVALFVSTCFVAIFKPLFWANSHLIGKMVLFALFIAGLFHLIGRLRSGFERYTYRDDNIHDSILENSEPTRKPYTRLAAACFLVFGTILSLAIGLVIGNFIDLLVGASLPSIFSTSLRPEFVFYPPIVVLFVDIMHEFISRFEY